MERLRLMSSDLMILCGLTNAPSANPDTMLGELCGRMGMKMNPQIKEHHSKEYFMVPKVLLFQCALPD